MKILLCWFLLLISFCALCSCNRIINNSCTPAQYLNHFSVDKNTYSADSAAICTQLYADIKRHEGFFYSKEFWDSTVIKIDTIIYNNTAEKMAILITTKNSTSRQLAPDTLHKWYFDGTSYLGYRRKNEIDLSWLGPSFSNSTNLRELLGTMSETFFCEFVLMRKSEPNSYNLNDVRLWKSKIWDKRFKSKISPH